LGAGGLVQRVLARGGSVLIALVTAGDGYVEAVMHQTGSLRPRPSQFLAYGEHRIREARRCPRARRRPARVGSVRLSRWRAAAAPARLLAADAPGVFCDDGGVRTTLSERRAPGGSL